MTSVDFAAAARILAGAARRCGLHAPSFRSPPRLIGVDRSLRRRGEAAVVSVRLRDRPWAAVLADMVEGVVVANGLGPPDADRVRAQMWSALHPGRAGGPSRAPGADRPAGPTPRGGRPAGPEVGVGMQVDAGAPRAKVA